MWVIIGSTSAQTHGKRCVDVGLICFGMLSSQDLTYFKKELGNHGCRKWVHTEGLSRESPDLPLFEMTLAMWHKSQEGQGQGRWVSGEAVSTVLKRSAACSSRTSRLPLFSHDLGLGQANDEPLKNPALFSHGSKFRGWVQVSQRAACAQSLPHALPE